MSDAGLPDAGLSVWELMAVDPAVPMDRAALRLHRTRTAILNPAVGSAAFKFDFRLELEVLGLAALPNDVGGSGRFLWR